MLFPINSNEVPSKSGPQQNPTIWRGRVPYDRDSGVSATAAVELCALSDPGCGRLIVAWAASSVLWATGPTAAHDSFGNKRIALVWRLPSARCAGAVHRGGKEKRSQCQI